MAWDDDQGPDRDVRCTLAVRLAAGTADVDVGWRRLDQTSPTHPSRRSDPSSSPPSQGRARIRHHEPERVPELAAHPEHLDAGDAAADAVATHRAGMCPRTDRRRIVLFGGADANAVYNETWEWNQTTWTQVTQILQPNPESGTMAFVPQIGMTLLFGGMDGNFNPNNDSWLNDGATWRKGCLGASSRLTSGATRWSPPSSTRWSSAARCSSATCSGDTWEFDGTAWTELHPATSPPARGTERRWPTISDRVVLFGERRRDEAVRRHTWEWDGTTWSERQPAHSPPPLQGASMAYDPRRDRVVMFGGGTTLRRQER